MFLKSSLRWEGESLRIKTLRMKKIRMSIDRFEFSSLSTSLIFSNKLLILVLDMYRSTSPE